MNSPQQSRQDQQIRVFISSTFKDMKEERDYLVKFTFPGLRKLCESRGVVWGEVDLRWGVTDEQKAEGRVLPICLEEIKRCRPYFIGLLGERYGWIPDAIPAEVIEREPWLTEHVHGRKSVTELEILHGVLNNPNMAEHAFFYFRDPVHVESLAEEAKKDFTAESTEDAERLRSLKERIRASGFPVRENYHDPKALGDLVLADLTAVIDKRWPEGSQPDPLNREAMDHEAYAQNRERVYIGRPECFAKLDAHADGSGDQPLVTLGESGCGKSALLANWVAHYRREYPDTLVLQHYIGATPYSAGWIAMLRRIMSEFKRHCNIQQDIPDKPDTLRSAFPNWLHMAATKGRIVLVLDALNQLEDRDGAPDLVWLPPVMPENLRLIVSTLPGRPLDEIKKRAWPTLEVEPLTVDERKELIRQFLRDYGRTLSPARVERIAAAPQSSNPLYLRVLLDELRLFGEHKQLEDRISHYLQAESPRDLYRKVIARWQADYGAGTTLVDDTLALLWAARRGLSETELLHALGKDAQPLPHAAWSPLYLAMSDALVSRGGLLTFAHDFLRTAAQDTCLPTDRQQEEVHLRLAGHFQRRPSGPRRTDELPWQLAQAKAWGRLQTLLIDRAFFAEAWDRNEFDVKAYWTQIEAGSPLRIVQASGTLIEHPEMEDDKNHLWRLSILLGDCGHLAEALRLRSTLVEHFKDAHDLPNLAGALVNQAVLLRARGNLDGAMALDKEAERIYRQLGDLSGLSKTLCKQAIVLAARGDLDGAMTLHKEEERICRQLGDLAGLSASLNNQATILYARGDLDGAMALYKEVEGICRQLGDLASLSTTLGNQALILHARGDLGEAMALQKGKGRICRQLGHLAGLSASLNNQATILYARGDLDGAMALDKEAEGICRQVGNLAVLQASLGSQALILYARGDLDGAMALHQEAERICRRLGDLAHLQETLNNQAVILCARGDLDGAMALHKETEGICRRLSSQAGLEVSLGGQASILYARGDLDGAMALYKEVEGICRRLGDLAHLQETLNNQAVILHVRRDLDRAMALYEEVERICRQVGNLTGLSRTLGNQGLILHDRGDLDGATARYKEKERICRQLGDLAGLQVSVAGQADVLYARRDLDGAMALYEEAERICRQSGDLAGLSKTLAIQGLILRDRGDLDGAMTRYKEKERICRQLGDLAGLSTTLGNQGLILHDRGDLDGAIALYKEAERILRQLGDLAGLSTTLGNQALILRTRGDLDGAMALQTEKEQICRQLGNLTGLSWTLGNQGLILCARGDLDGTIARYKEVERICRQLGDLAGLSRSLDDQASILRARGNLDGAMALHQEAECICRQAGDLEGLAISLVNRVATLAQMGRAREGLPFAEEAYKIATRHGYVALAKQIEAILSSVRQASEEG